MQFEVTIHRRVLRVGPSYRDWLVLGGILENDPCDPSISEVSFVRSRRTRPMATHRPSEQDSTEEAPTFGKLRICSNSTSEFQIEISNKDFDLLLAETRYIHWGRDRISLCAQADLDIVVENGKSLPVGCYPITDWKISLEYGLKRAV